MLTLATRPAHFGVLLLWLVLIPWAAASVEGAGQHSLSAEHRFNPRSYEKSVAICKAINRLENVEKDIEIHYVDVNPKAEKTLLLVHGWPSLWASWSNQIEEFKNDYHLVIPDLRGFGSSTHPGDVESSGTMQDHVSDLACVLAHAGVQKAVCIGHDWGSQICWEAGRLRPDVFNGIVANILPYMHSAGEFVPTSALVPLLPKLGYTVFFSTRTADAVLELDKDIRKSLRVPLGNPGRANTPPEFLASTETFMGPWDELELEKIPFFTQDEEDYWVEQYSIQGFRHTLQFYTHGNRYGSWKHAHDQGNFTIPQPALSIFPTKDPVANWVQMSTILGSEKYVPQLTVKTIETSHWTPLEKPEEFNRIVREWLSTFEDKSSVVDNQRRVIDEL